MRSIAQTVAEGIRTADELQEALRTAMRIEFATIPPYLCAEWSVDTSPGGDPSGVRSMIRTIAIQEMSHFALVGNILSAVGGAFEAAVPGLPDRLSRRAAARRHPPGGAGGYPSVVPPAARGVHAN